MGIILAASGHYHGERENVIAFSVLKNERQVIPISVECCCLIVMNGKHLTELSNNKK